MTCNKTILFDLDGTLTDSGEGIMNCICYALDHFGLPIPSPEALRSCVGPPLHDSFSRFGVPQDRLDEAVTVYRQRYLPIGKFENHPYPGVERLLARLREAGCRLYVATSKPEITSVEILTKFNMAHYFDIIAGAAMDRSRSTKEEVIAYLLEQTGNLENVIMVGDTKFDVLGAKAHGIDTIGVRWGYGSVAEMEDAGAKAIAQDMDHLFDLLTQ